MNISLKAVGEIRAELLKESGEIEVYEFRNLVVNVGKAFIAQSMRKTTTNSPAAMTHMGVGSGATAAAGGDTALVSQTGTRASVVATAATVNVLDDTVEYTAEFLPGNGTGNLNEAGIFNASSGGIMLSRAVFPLITKGIGDSLTLSWKITIQ